MPVAVGDAVGVDVAVAVIVGVAVDVGVLVAVAVGVGVAEAVADGVGETTGVGVGVIPVGLGLSTWEKMFPGVSNAAAQNSTPTKGRSLQGRVSKCLCGSDFETNSKGLFALILRSCARPWTTLIMSFAGPQNTKNIACKILA